MSALIRAIRTMGCSTPCCPEIMPIGGVLLMGEDGLARCTACAQDAEVERLYAQRASQGHGIGASVGGVAQGEQGIPRVYRGAVTTPEPDQELAANATAAP